MERSRTLVGTARRNLARVIRPDVRITPPPAGVRLDRDVAVTVRDGTALRVNVFRPAAEGRYPVLLCAQPYGKDRVPARSRSGRAVPLQYRLASNDEPMTFSAWTSLEAPDPAFWVPRGYVLVIGDLRGWGTSDGVAEAFRPAEGDDVHDLIEWAAAQPWSNGRVGMSGVSYLAITQWTGAATRPPHLAAINPWEGFTDPYPDFAYPGGIRENGFMVVWSAWQRFLRPRSGSFRGQQKRHPLRDGWWGERSPELEKIDVPTLVCGSFSDHSLHSRGSFEGFRRIGSAQKWLYTHRAPKWSTYYGKPALDARTKFFDHVLRGDDTGILEQAPVRIEVRESLSRIAAIRIADRWPPAQARPLTLHLDAAERLLSAAPPSTAATVDAPRTGVRFRWRFDQETDVVGPMRLRLRVSAERPDVTVFAGIRKIHRGREVVFEGSYGFTEDIVTRGWLRASHRAVDDTRSTEWEAWHPHTSAEPIPPASPSTSTSPSCRRPPGSPPATSSSSSCATGGSSPPTRSPVSSPRSTNAHPVNAGPSTPAARPPRRSPSPSGPNKQRSDHDRHDHRTGPATTPRPATDAAGGRSGRPRPDPARRSRAGQRHPDPRPPRHRAPRARPHPPGWDGTPRPDRLHSVADLAVTYLDLLEQLELTDVAVVGSSFGGWIAAEMGIRARASRLSRLVLLDAVGPTPSPTQTAAAPPPPGRGPSPADLALLQGYTGPAMHDPGLLPRLAAVRVPVLVLWGERDPVVPPDYGRAYADAFADAQFEVIPGAGHLPTSEAPEPTFTAIDTLLLGQER